MRNVIRTLHIFENNFRHKLTINVVRESLDRLWSTIFLEIFSKDSLIQMTPHLSGHFWPLKSWTLRDNKSSDHQVVHNYKNISGMCMFTQQLSLQKQWTNSTNILTIMLLVANLSNTKRCKKPKKWPKPWHMGTHLRVLKKCFPMNTKMTGLKWFSYFFVNWTQTKVTQDQKG